jgi:hypothetical protein
MDTLSSVWVKVVKMVLPYINFGILQYDLVSELLQNIHNIPNLPILFASVAFSPIG